MADEVIFAGGELDSLTTVGGSPSESNAGVFDSSYARRAILTTDSAAIVRGRFIDSDSDLTSVVTGETLWFHVEVYYGGTTDVTRIIRLIDGSNQPWFALRGGGTSGTIRAVYNSGSGGTPTWTDLGVGSFSTGSDAVKRFDIKLTLGSPHSYEIYYADALVASGTFTQAALTELSGFELNGHSGGGDCYWSQPLATRNIGTVGAKVRTRAASAAGTTNTFTSGAYTDINEGALNDTTAMVSDTAGQLYTFAMEDVTTPGGLFIRSIFTWARGKNGGSPPNNFRHVIRRGSTNYESPDVANIGSGYAPLGAQWPTDPAGGNWDDADWNAAELGGKSVT